MPASALAAGPVPASADGENASLFERARAGTLPIEALMERASALQAAGQAETAAALYEAWLDGHGRSPLRHVAAFNWGTVLGALGRSDAAEQAYRRALAGQPNFPPARLNLGHLLERRGDADGALAEWAQVLALTDPPAPATRDFRLHALNNSARLAEQIKRLPEAEAFLRQSLELNPEQFDVIQHLVHVRQKLCAWPVRQPFGRVTANQLLVGTSPLAMLGLDDDPALQLLAAQRFVHERVPKPPPVPLHRRIGRPREGRIRIGYASGDLHHHAVGLLTAELYELHDRRRFEVWAFDWTPDSATPQRQRLLKAFDHHVRLAGVDDATAARLIAEAGIDVLVDLQGITNGARPGILVQRPAPVQVSYLGLPATSALPGVDWILADDFLLPPELEPYLTERPLRVPGCYQVSDRQREVAPVPERARYGLPDDAFVFCSFNNTFKFTEPVFDAWMRVLRAVPGSVLWLLADHEAVQANLRAAAAARGVDAARLHFAPRVGPAEYLARFALADLMLDTFPYNAGTTASDALWMGLPILTVSGRSVISRMAGSLLHAVGLPDLVTASLAEYERRAIEIGRTPARAASYRRYLAEHGRQSALFDVPAIVRGIEAHFERLALEHRRLAFGAAAA